MLVTRGENPFLEWRSDLQVVTTTGDSISWEPVIGEDDEVRFRTVGGTNDGTEFWAVVGTLEDLKEARRELLRVMAEEGSGRDRRQ